MRLGARLARTLKPLHASGESHGRIGAEAILLPTRLLADAVLIQPQKPRARPLKKSGPAGLAADTVAIARLVHFAITAHETAAGERPPPLAVFDSGDDELDQTLNDVFLRATTPTPATLDQLCESLDRWLEAEGALVDEPLAWEEEAAEPSIDLSTLPPPPAAPLSQAGYGLDEATLDFEEDGERPTVPGSVEQPPRRMPKLVPPKLGTRPSKGRSAEKEQADDAKAPDSAPLAEREPANPRAGWPWLAAVASAAAVVIVWFATRGSTSNMGDAQPSSGAERPADSLPLASQSGAPARAASELTNSLRATANPASATAAASTPSVATASSAPVAAPEALERCITRALPADTFEGTFTDFSPVCAASEVLDGSQRFREMIVRAGHGRAVTSGMKEWSLLGFFELAAFAVLRQRCCNAEPIAVPSSPESCPVSMEKAIRQLEAADFSSKKQVASAIDQLEKAARCITRSGAEKRFGGHPALSGGEGTPLKRIVKRLGEPTSAHKAP